MNEDEIISLLKQQISFLKERLEPANQNLLQANGKIDSLLAEVSSLRSLLEDKQAEEDKQKRVIKGLTKIMANVSEKQDVPSAGAGTSQPVEHKERPKTDNGAKRKTHCEV